MYVILALLLLGVLIMRARGGAFLGGSRLRHHACRNFRWVWAR